MQKTNRFRHLGVCLFILWAIAILAHRAAPASGRHAPIPEPSPVASVEPEPLPSGAPGIRFEPVDYYTTPEERLEILAASAITDSVIHSPCFATWMMARALIQTNNQTNAQVIARLQGLSATLPVEMYSRCLGKAPFCTSAVAYRQPPDMTVHLNRNYFNSSKPPRVWAATLAHEGDGHAAGGYDHDYNWSPSRSYSVPYSLGGGDKAQGGDVFDTCYTH